MSVESQMVAQPATVNTDYTDYEKICALEGPENLAIDIIVGGQRPKSHSRRCRQTLEGGAGPKR